MHPWDDMETDTFSLPPATMSLMLTASLVTLVTLESSPIDQQSPIPWLCPFVVSLPAFRSSPVTEWCCALRSIHHLFVKAVYFSFYCLQFADHSRRSVICWTNWSRLGSDNLEDLEALPPWNGHLQGIHGNPFWRILKQVQPVYYAVRAVKVGEELFFCEVFFYKANNNLTVSAPFCFYKLSSFT